MTPVYVINLDRQPERWKRIKANADEIGVTLTRFPAIDRKTDFGPTLQDEFGQGRGIDPPRRSPGDICCSLSHVRVWQRLIESEVPGAIVLEDDAKLDSAFTRFLGKWFRETMVRHGIGCAKLEYIPTTHSLKSRPLGRFVCDLPEAGAAKLYLLNGSFIGAGAYYISRKAAEDVLRDHSHLRVPVDHFLFNRSVNTGFKTVRPGFVTPAPVLHDLLDVPSDLDGQRGPHRDQCYLSDKPNIMEAALRKLKQEFHGLQRAVHKVTGARKIDVEFSGDLSRTESLKDT
jgi:glycosyl transferase family 25